MASSGIQQNLADRIKRRSSYNAQSKKDEVITGLESKKRQRNQKRTIDLTDEEIDYFTKYDDWSAARNNAKRQKTATSNTGNEVKSGKRKETEPQKLEDQIRSKTKKQRGNDRANTYFFHSRSNEFFRKY